MPQKRKSLDESAREFFVSKAPQSPDELAKPTDSVPLESIRLTTQQPRRYFDPEKMQQLIVSVKQHGILEPLLVRPIPGGQYELVAGERRYRAAIEVKLASVPIVSRTLTDEEALQLALIENLQREDLNPVEETEGIIQLLAIKLDQPREVVISHLYRMYNEVKGNVGKFNPNVRVSDERSDQNTFNPNVRVSDDHPDQDTFNPNVRVSDERSDQNTFNPNVRVSDERSDQDTFNPNVRVSDERSDQDTFNPNVRVNAETQVVQELFDSLGLMTWESFVKNRLPLLNLPDEILETLRRGEIAYTKATAIARVRNEVQRQSLLKEAIESNLSLAKIRERIDQLKDSEPGTDSSKEPPLKSRMDKAYQVIKKSKMWSDPKKQKGLEKLVAAIEALINE
jgi:ParB family transcriptional regulator, chromosome partitioning protein